MKLSTVLVIITSYVTLGSARTGFAKDENEDLIEFPPTVLRRFDDSGIPVGHLRPLGQSPRCMPSLLIFYSVFMCIIMPRQSRLPWPEA